jgi:D-aminopeptidase
MRMPGKHLAAAAILLIVLGVAQGEAPAARPRAPDLGLKVGVLPRGPLDAITDVAGVAVGEATSVRGDNIRTGVTAIVPHPGNLYREKVPGAIYVGNGYGKLTINRPCLAAVLRPRRSD